MNSTVAEFASHVANGDASILKFIKLSIARFLNCSIPQFRFSLRLCVPVVNRFLQSVSVVQLRIQHDLPEHLALFHVLVCGPGFAKRKDAVYHGLQFAAEHMLENFV